MKFPLKTIIGAWLPLAVVTTLAFGAIYATGQQIYRQSANDQLLEIVQTASIMIKHGQDPTTLAKAQPQLADIDTLAPFVTLYTQQLQPITSSLAVPGIMPPDGTFAAAKTGPQRFSWAPQGRSGPRFAAVLSYYHGYGYILAAKSLQPAEQHISDSGLMLAAGWAGTMLVSLMTVGLLNQKNNKASLKL